MVAVAAATFALTQLVEALNEIMRVLVTDDAAVFVGVLIPCKVIAGLGIIYGLAPLLNVSADRLKEHTFQILFTLLLAATFMGNGKMARAIGIANYATIKGIDAAIHNQMEQTGNITKLVENIQNDGLATAVIQRKLDACVGLPQAQADGTPNPVATQCEAALRQLLQTQKIANPDLAAQFQTALSKGNLLEMGSILINGTVGLPGAIGRGIGNVALEIPKALFNGWKAAIATIADMAFVLSLMILPIPLCFSLLNTAPLMVWFSSLWAVGFYKFALTVLAGSFTIIAAKLGPGLPIFMFDLLTSVVAPILAGVMAAGGGIGLFKLFEQVAQALMQMLGKSAGAGG
jgi:hypothetical protein